MADNLRADGMLEGDRIYKGKGIGEITIWKCPRCATENSGPIDKGCTSCGSGSAQARHVGVPPPPRRRGTTTLRGRPLDDDGAIEFTTPAALAFDRWYANHVEGSYDDQHAPRYLLLEAWTAAIAWVRQHTVPNREPVDDPDPTGEVSVPSVLVPRALIQDVIRQLETVVDVPETESQSPELLALINQLRELVE